MRFGYGRQTSSGAEVQKYRASLSPGQLRWEVRVRVREIFIIHVSNVPMCGQVRVERRLLQPHGCDELSDDQTRVQDAGQPTAEEPSQRSQQR